MRFGPHLTLDLSGCDSERLGDLSLVFNVLADLPDAIGMTRITQPYVFPYSGLVPEDKGITGFVVIAESHISIHTFQDKNYAFVDVFSCKEFDCDLAADYVTDRFGATHVVKHVVERGKNFPREVPFVQSYCRL